MKKLLLPISLQDILLEAINESLSQTYCDELDNTDCENWSDSLKFEWAYKKYMIEEGVDIIDTQQYVSVDSLKNWLQGLALPVPFYNDDIEEFGHDPDTYWDNLADCLRDEIFTAFS